MRGNPLLALVLIGLALSACKGGGNSASLDLCGLNCPPSNDDDDDGGGDDTVPPGDDTTPGDGDNSGGNETSLSSGDTTIAFEAGKLVRPDSGTSLSRLTVGTSPSRALFEIDTKTDSNNTWLPPDEMNEYPTGSNATSVFSPNNLEANSYKEYRNISGNGVGRDEVLQVWNFGSSYATQYRNVADGKAAQQAFSFGGNRTALGQMPKTASATYTGRYGTTSEASNWINPDKQVVQEVVIDRNGVFATNGGASVTADFGAQKIDGLLTPEHVRYHDGKSFKYYDIPTNTIHNPDGSRFLVPDEDGRFVNSVANAPGFWSTPIELNGTIAGNTYSGTAKLSGSFVTGDNPMYGGFFGRNASQTTGAFTLKGSAVAPIGGEFPINDDRRGFLSHSGVFNGHR